MERRLLLFVLIILLPALSIMSCKKEDPPDSPVVTRDWHGVAYGVDNNGNGVIEPNEITNHQQEYQHFIFNTDGTGRYYDDATANVSLTWALTGEGMRIDFNPHLPTFDTDLFHIDSLTLHDLILSDTNKAGHVEWHSFAR